MRLFWLVLRSRPRDFIDELGERQRETARVAAEARHAARKLDSATQTMLDRLIEVASLVRTRP